ncbi:MAG TPA: C25 family cysteine peptidase, partial [Candidatus Eisenbacteria bacterium]|nr:C25 family cysteine peptidase [Candidatus Eisenbacteria bacterium]
MFLSLLAPPAAPAAEAPIQAGARVIAQDVRGVTLEYVAAEATWDTLAIESARYERVRVPGASVVEAPGRPALPVAIVSIAVPDGMSASLRIESEEASDRPGLPPVPVAAERFVSNEPSVGPVSEYRYEPEASLYSGVRLVPESVARLETGGAVGELWVVPIHLAPVRWNPAARTYRLLRRAVVRVDFVPATDRERALRAVARPGSDSEARRRMQRRLIANDAAARTFPRRPAEAPLRFAERRLLDGNPEFRISVTQTGWVSVTQASLAGAGFPAGISIANVGVWERGYDDAGDSATAASIPVVARDGNGNGVFDAGDAITFYARSLRDRVGAASIENRYSDANVYWLTWTAAAAAVPDTIDGVIPTPSVTAPAFFREILHLEQDAFMLASPNQTVASPPEAVPYLFWTNGREPDQFEAPIPFLDALTTQPVRIRARYQGQIGSLHRLSMFFESSTGARDTLALNDVSFNQEIVLLDTGYTIPGSRIGPGVNKYVHVGDRQSLSGGAFLPGSAAWLDWVDVDYARRYVARNNALAFTSGGSGSVAEITVTGFTASGIEVYDVTLPQSPERVAGAVVSGSSGAFQVVFRTNAFAAERRFVALVPGAEAVVAAGRIAADIASTLRTPGPFGSSEARAILIAPRDFFAAATRLADYRRAQGYAVELADLQDVYDEFNGGVKSARAIRRYLRHAHLAWTPGPTFVALLGDGSMDHKGRLATSSVDWVPTYLRFEFIAGPQGSELVGQDSYYTINLSQAQPADNDVMPTLVLGRIPAGSTAELDAFVTKLIQYEAYQPTDTWRGRQLLISDDEYSTTIFFSGGYCLQPQESLFKQSNQNMADRAAQSASGQDLQSVFYDLKTYTDAIPTYVDGFGNTCKSASGYQTVLSQAGGGYDQLIQRLSQGALIANVQAHANRYLVAHEQIYCIGSTFFCSSLVGPDQVQNVDRPFLWMVWGCHAAQFPDGPRADGASDSSDAQGEQLLLLPNRGAIQSLGSTGYEFLQTNSTFNDFVAEGLYTVPPVGAPGGPARWILGEVFLHAYARNAQTGFITQQVMNRTIHILGDPMTRMDALAPRIFEVTVDGNPAASGGALTTDSPTDSLALVVKVRDEVAVTR